MNIQEENSALYFRVQSEREQTLGLDFIGERAKRARHYLVMFMET